MYKHNTFLKYLIGRHFCSGIYSKHLTGQDSWNPGYHKWMGSFSNKRVKSTLHEHLSYSTGGGGVWKFWLRFLGTEKQAMTNMVHQYAPTFAQANSDANLNFHLDEKSRLWYGKTRGMLMKHCNTWTVHSVNNKHNKIQTAFSVKKYSATHALLLTSVKTPAIPAWHEPCSSPYIFL